MRSFIPAMIMKKKSTDYFVQYVEEVLLKSACFFEAFQPDIPHYFNPILPPQWRIQGRGPGGPPPLILDQTEAQRAEEKKLETDPPPTLSRGLDDRAPLLSQGMDLALLPTRNTPLRILKSSLLSLRSYVW